MSLSFLQKIMRSVATTALAIALLSACTSPTPNTSEPFLGAALTPEQQADERRWHARFHKKIYATTGLGYSWLEPNTRQVVGWDVNDRGNAGGQIAIGTDINKRISLELHSADLGSAGLSPSGRINYHLHGGSALMYAGKNTSRNGRRGLNGYARIGMGLLENSAVGNVDYVKDNSTHVLFGAGVEYATRMGLGLRAELIAYDEDVKYGQLGVIYRIGRDYQRKPVKLAAAPIDKTPEVAAAIAISKPIIEPIFDPCESISGRMDGVNFHSGSAELTAASKLILDAMATSLNQCLPHSIEISAHTDSQGSESYNQVLSQNRANSVTNYLGQIGVNTHRLQPIAFGESLPIDSNETAAGRRNNRRVELLIKLSIDKIDE